MSFTRSSLFRFFRAKILSVTNGTIATASNSTSTVEPHWEDFLTEAEKRHLLEIRAEYEVLKYSGKLKKNPEDIP